MNRTYQRMMFGVLVTMLAFQPVGLTKVSAKNAESTKQEVQEKKSEKIITGFEKLSDEESYFQESNEEKIEAIIDGFPTKLNVSIEGEKGKTAIPVTWENTDTYAKGNDIWCYEYTPQWDEEAYVLSDDVNRLTEVPVIIIDRQMEVDDEDDPQYYRAMGYDDMANGISAYKLTEKNYTHNARYSGCDVVDVIDVSRFQGEIDWNKVRQSGVEYAFIRVGYRGYTQGTLVEDEWFRRNYERATAAGVKIGVYIFSQAITESEAVEEANYVLSRISPASISLPVVIDYEYASGSKGETGRLLQANLSVDAATNIVNRFCSVVEDAGYTPMVYANKSMLERHLNASKISSNYPIWLANYTTQTGYSGEYSFWQYSSEGAIAGINGRVDSNFWYRIPGSSQKLLSENVKLRQGANGKWYSYVNGNRYWNYTGMALNENGWWYVKNGQLDWSYTGMALNENGWWYIKNGQLDTNYTGMALNEYGWWYFRNGQLDWNYTGMALNEYGWWYFRNGQIDWNYTGMALNEYGWWYFRNGQLDWNYTGMALNENGWWYFNNGQLDWNYTGMALNEYGWWYFRNGQIDWNYTGMALNEYGWWYFRNGQLDWNYTGMALNEYGWWYFNNGQLDWNYTGPAENEYGQWHFTNGRLDGASV